MFLISFKPLYGLRKYLGFPGRASSAMLLGFWFFVFLFLVFWFLFLVFAFRMAASQVLSFSSLCDTPLTIFRWALKKLIKTTHWRKNKTRRKSCENFAYPLHGPTLKRNPICGKFIGPTGERGPLAAKRG
jgi:hypothetical protein